MHSFLVKIYIITAFCFLATVQLATADIGSVDLVGSPVLYKEKTGESSYEMVWKEYQNGEQRIITLDGDGKRYINVCQASTGETVEWQLNDEDGLKVTAVRNGKTIQISGRKKGKSFEKSLEIDDRPWYQPMSYSLRNFLHSEKQATSFWIIRDSNLKPYAMKAEKVGKEEIATVSGPVLAEKVEIRAEGLFSALWHGTYWYSVDSKVFLQYHSTHGLGAEPTLVTISSVKSN